MSQNTDFGAEMTSPPPVVEWVARKARLNAVHLLTQRGESGAEIVETLDMLGLLPEVDNG